MNEKWHDDHKKAIAEKWVQCPQIEARAEELRQKWATGQIGISALCKAHAHAENEIAELKADLAEAQTEVERLALEVENQQYTITCASEENQQLKESLAETRADIEKLNKNHSDALDTILAMLIAARGEEYDLETLEREMNAVSTKPSGYIRHCIAERDKLVEQILEALKALKQRHYVNDEDNWYSCPASGLCSNDNAGTDCNCGADYANSIIEAALSAAERGGE